MKHFFKISFFFLILVLFTAQAPKDAQPLNLVTQSDLADTTGHTGQFYTVVPGGFDWTSPGDFDYINLIEASTGTPATDSFANLTSTVLAAPANDRVIDFFVGKTVPEMTGNAVNGTYSLGSLPNMSMNNGLPRWWKVSGNCNFTGGGASAPLASVAVNSNASGFPNDCKCDVWFDPVSGEFKANVYSNLPAAASPFARLYLVFKYI